MVLAPDIAGNILSSEFLCLKEQKCCLAIFKPVLHFLLFVFHMDTYCKLAVVNSNSQTALFAFKWVCLTSTVPEGLEGLGFF